MKKIHLNRNKLRKNLRMILITLCMTAAFTSAAFASNAAAANNDIMTGLANLKTLFFGILSLIGVIAAGKGIADFSSALQAQDGASMKQAGFAIAGGLIMAFASSVLAIIGVS